jgi:hypothetical protein
VDDDQLIDAIRERAADPERLVDSRPTEFFASVKGMSLGGLFSAARSAMADAMRAAHGDVDDELIGKAHAYQAAMNRPAERALPARATPEAIEAAEARIGHALPPLLRRLYLEVANGGFGPGSGIIGVAGGWTDESGRTIDRVHAMMAEGDPDEPRWRWPTGLVPIVDASPVWTCVDTATPEGRIVDFDFEQIEYEGWDASFTDVSPSLREWLTTWVLSRPAHEAQREELAALMAESQIRAAREAREAIGRMSLDERRAMGLPDEGWEREVFGGIGLESDEPGGDR